MSSVPSGRSGRRRYLHRTLPDLETEKNRVEILAAAAVAFMRNGYAATSVDMVADALGSTKGRIYYYYKSKADLFLGIHREATTLALRTVMPLARREGTATDRLRSMVLAHADLVMSRTPLMRVAAQGLDLHLTGATTPAQRNELDAILQMRDEYELSYVEVVTAGIRSREFRPCNPEIVVKTVLGGLNWMIVWFPPPGADSAELRRQVTDEAVAMLFHGLLAVDHRPG